MPKKSQKNTTIIGELHNEYCKKYNSKNACENFELPKIPCLYNRLVDAYKQQKNTCCSSSKQNWRYEVQPNISIQNKGEKVLEKDVVIKRTPEADWANQVPIASGVFSSTADKKRAVDLVHKVNNDAYEYEFIELKTELKTDNPVYAALEILLYGIVYVFYRKYAMEQYEKNKEKDLPLATSVVLVVAAPKEYYEGYELKKFEDELSKNLREWVTTVLPNFSMTFRFDSFKYSANSRENVDNFLHKTSLFN